MSLPFPLNKIPWNENIRNVLIYFLSSGFSRAIPFFLLPFLTRVLSPADFGILGLATVFLGLFTRLITLGAPDYILAHYHKYSPLDMNLRLSVLPNIAACSALFFILLTTVVHLSIGTGTSLPYWTFLCIIICAYFTSILYIAQALNQLEIRVSRYVSYEMINALINGTFVIVLVLMWGMKWEGRFLSIIIGYGTTGALALFYLISSRPLVITFAAKLIKEFLRFSLPLLPHSLGLWILNGFARLFLARYVNLAEAGYFHVAVQLLTILTLAYDALFKVWNPFFFHKITTADQEPGAKLQIAKYSYICIAGIFLMSIFYLVLANSIISIFIHEKYAPSANYLSWLTCSLIAYSITRIFANFLYHSGKTNLLGLATTISALVFVPLVFLINHISGPVGVAQAMFLSFGLHALLVISFALHAYPMPWILKDVNHASHTNE